MIEVYLEVYIYIGANLEFVLGPLCSLHMRFKHCSVHYFRVGLNCTYVRMSEELQQEMVEDCFLWQLPDCFDEPCLFLIRLNTINVLLHCVVLR